MAGSYPDVPGRRMAWDDDGSIGFRVPIDFSLAVTEMTPTNRSALNDENQATNMATGTGPHRWFGVIFPELREVDGFSAATSSTGGTPNDGVGEVRTSGDTTNGVDGTWTQRIADYNTGNGTVQQNYRNRITSLAVSNVRSLRCHQGQNNLVIALHIYGEIAAGETPDRLLWVDNNTGSEFGLPIDYGDIPRGSAEDREVKLRNNSTTMTAASVQVTAEALYLNSGAWYTIKEASGSFQSTLPLTSSIGSSSDSPVLTIRRVTPDSETLSLHAARVYANVGSWS
jgi:hypothetical protein